MHPTPPILLLAVDIEILRSPCEDCMNAIFIGQCFKNEVTKFNRGDYENKPTLSTHNTIQYAYHEAPTFPSWLHALHHSIGYSIIAAHNDLQQQTTTI